MKVNIEDTQQAISHLFLNDVKVCEAVADTKEWKEDGVIECQVFFNGIKTDASILENTLHHFVDSIEKQFKEKYDADRLDQVIEERAKELIKEHADNALDKIYSLTRKLEEADDQLVPHWDREKQNREQTKLQMFFERLFTLGGYITWEKAVLENTVSTLDPQDQYFHNGRLFVRTRLNDVSN